jgi:uncharacterized protein YlxW (UPF0749 family)
MRIKEINEIIAARATNLIATMWCVYVFTIFALLPVFFSKLGPVIGYISSSFLQLIFLPLIMVGQTVLNRASEQRAEQDHQALMEQIEEIKDMHRDLHDLIAEVKDIDTVIDDVEEVLKKDED